MKAVIAMFALAFSFVSVPAMADQQVIDAVIGAVVGGGGARALSSNVQSNSKRNMITAAGALGGAWVGSRIGDDSGTRHQQNYEQRERQMAMQQQQSYSQPSAGSYSRTVQPVYVDNNDGWVEQPVQQVQPVQRVVRQAPQTRQIAVQRDGCDEEYYRGQFNPEMAQAYCQGRRERLRQAYAEGLAGR